jgi:hypothetical protein
VREGGRGSLRRCKRAFSREAASSFARSFMRSSFGPILMSYHLTPVPLPPTPHSPTQQAHEETKAFLARERESVMRLEVEVAELRKKLQGATELQKEVEAFRRAAKEAEAKAKAGGGIWGFVSGQ